MSKYLQIVVFSMITLCGHLQAAELPSSTDDELEQWFEDDSELRALSVNEGELNFLLTPPDKPAHHHHNIITLSSSSLLDGWGKLHQCHENLDPVGQLQIVYRAGRIRNIHVVSSKGIGKIWVEGPSLQLEDISPGATLCIAADSRMLQMHADGSFTLHNGPFMRRFLDGYYPMHVNQEIQFPTAITLLSVEPSPGPGFHMKYDQNTLVLDTWFEGILNITVRFSLAK